MKKYLTLALMCALPSLVHANFKGIYFEHKDWELACDNSGTCRAAGYQADETDENIVSVLLTREAGKKGNRQVTGLVNLQTENLLHQDLTLTLVINGKNYGKVFLPKDQDITTLTAKQVQAIIAHAKQNANIVFQSDKQTWQLSDQGLSAVLLKMDVYQQRLNTPSALIQQGNGANPSKDFSLPVLQDKPLPKKLTTQTIAFDSKQGKHLWRQLKTSMQPDDECLNEPEYGAVAFSVTPLSATQKLVSCLGWRGAYNQGYHVWLMNNDLSKVQQYIGRDLTDFPSHDNASNQIKAEHKVRGVGDCWSLKTWAWDGKKFVKTMEATTGLCRGFAGGAWYLPTYFVDIASDKSDNQLLSNR